MIIQRDNQAADKILLYNSILIYNRVFFNKKNKKA